MPFKHVFIRPCQLACIYVSFFPMASTNVSLSSTGRKACRVDVMWCMWRERAGLYMCYDAARMIPWRKKLTRRCLGLSKLRSILQLQINIWFLSGVYTAQKYTHRAVWVQGYMAHNKVSPTYTNSQIHSSSSRGISSRLSNRRMGVLWHLANWILLGFILALTFWDLL